MVSGRQGYDETSWRWGLGQPPFFDPTIPNTATRLFVLAFTNCQAEKGEYLTHREADEAVKLIRQWKDQPFHPAITLCCAYTYPGDSRSGGQVQIQEECRTN